MSTEIDFNILFNGQTASFFLDEKVAEFLYHKKSVLLIPNDILRAQALPAEEVSFSHYLVKTGTNQWHIISNDNLAAGVNGLVREAKFKIIVSYDNTGYTAHVVAVNDVVKVQFSAEPNSSHEELVTNVLNEARNQKRHHVHVIKVIDTGEEVITVSENCGVSLDTLLPFTPGSKQHAFRFRWEIACRIASEMLLLQQCGTVHQDIKPANICYQEIPANPQLGIPEGQFRIIFIDFGLSKDIDTVSNKISGTLDYIAPEVMCGEGSSYQSDMYSLAGVLGALLGADDLCKYKLCYQNPKRIAMTPYCFDNLFTGYDVSDLDPYFLDDIRVLLEALQSRHPEQRPTIVLVSKFFALSKARIDAYEAFREDWQLMTQNFAQLDACYRQLDSLTARYRSTQYQMHQFNESNPFSREFKRSLILQRRAIYKELAALPSRPQSHYELSACLAKDNRLADFYSQDCPYPDLKKIIALLQEENAKLGKVLQGFTRGPGAKTKFTEIMEVLSSTMAPTKDLEKLQTIGEAKINHQRRLNRNRPRPVAHPTAVVCRPEPATQIRVSLNQEESISAIDSRVFMG